MQLAAFSVSNFRSITAAKKVNLSNYSVLVGANNEGKSNILHALALGLEAIEAYKYSVTRDRLGRITRPSQTLLGSRSRYRWSQDFPISKQKGCKDTDCTEIILEFELSQEEVEQFKEQIKSQLNGTLPVAIRFFQNKSEITIAKQGRGGPALSEKGTRVADFVSKRVNFDYIPAIRTSESAEEVISELVSKELAKLETNPDYMNALGEIERIQKPILASLSATIKETVSSFLPSVKSVQVAIPKDSRTRAFRRGIIIEVDDGNLTSLERKGDGVKSLVALALMRHASTLSESTGSTIIAIEEPEAHLHPHAVHELRDVLVGLSEKNQVIVTSHSPLFVNPAKLESTVVVRGSKAAPARSISEVREVLGVRLSDNLQSARLVAICEGTDDIISLRAILSDGFPALRDALAQGDLVFDDLGGASNLAYKVRTYRSSASMVQCFLDSDKAGIAAVKKALSDGVLKESDYNLINISGQTEAELEDLFDTQFYKNDFLATFGVDPTIKPPAAKGKKWSDAMEVKFKSHGKLWDDSQEMRVKLWVAEHVQRHPKEAVIQAKFAPIQAFAESLIRKLEG